MRAFSPDRVGQSAILELLEKLVAFDTVSSRPNVGLIGGIASYLDAHGVEAVRLDSPEDGKAGLIASIGPVAPGGVVLSGHTDVVPVEGQVWSSDPFALVERDGRLHGRGTADMKGFIAAVLASVPLFMGTRLRVPIHLAFSHDEEIGCLGAPMLIEALSARVPPPAAVLVGEPTGLQVADRHRGITTFNTAISGRGGHSAKPARGVNAIDLAARFIRELEEVANELGSGSATAVDGVPEHTTINVGRIEGGSAVNMIAEHCRMIWECRTQPGLAAAQIIEAVEVRLEPLMRSLRSRTPEVAIRTEPLISVPPLVALPHSAAVDLALQLTGQNECIAAPFASEAGLFQEAGMPAVVCGPGRVTEAHQPDEFVSRAQLNECLGLMQRLSEWASE